MRSEIVEKWLTDAGATFSFQERFNLSKIDREESFRNQARIGAPIDEDVVLTYAVAMDKGDVFPPIVVYQKNGRYVNIDGNHRYDSARMVNKDHLPAYTVDNPTPALVALLTYNANTKHGKPTSLQERLRQGTLLVEMGATRADVARNLNVPIRQLNAHIDQVNTDKRFQSLGITRWDSLARGIRTRLNDIRADRVMKAAANITIRAKLVTEDVNRLVKEINEKRNESEQIKVVTSWQERTSGDAAETGGGLIPIPKPIMYITQVLTRLENLDPATLDNANLSDEYRVKLTGKIMAGADRLRQIANRVNKQKG